MDKKRIILIIAIVIVYLIDICFVMLILRDRCNTVNPTIQGADIDTFTQYVGENKSGSQVTNVINTIIVYNAVCEDYPIKLTYGDTSYEGEDISSVLKNISNKKRYDIDVKMDKIGRVNEVVVTEMESSSNP